MKDVSTMTYRVLTLTVSLMLAGCAFPYVPDPAIPHTSLNTSSLPQARICIDGDTYRLTSSSDNIASIPTGKRISLLSSFQAGNGYVTHFCTPQISFVANENTNYVATLLFKNNACYLQVLQENANTPSGLDWEWSMGRGTCSK